MRELVERLCAPECAGRRAGTPGGALARRLVVEALRAQGLAPREQPVPACGGANVLAVLPGRVDRWIVVGAHYDHLGVVGGDLYAGADDNAAAVAILVDVAASLAEHGTGGRGVVVAAFDAEEPPHFAQGSMGSQAYVKDPVVPLERTDLMICMDLVGHAFGGSTMPAPVRETLFALGAERSVGTPSMVDALAGSVPGVAVRRADAEIIPPLSDYLAFWEREVPFLFLTAGRWRHYHRPSDTPEKLDYAKMAAISRWLTAFVRQACSDAEDARFLASTRDDASTLRSLLAVLEPLSASGPRAADAQVLARMLLEACDARGVLPDRCRAQLAALIGGLESSLA